MMVEDAFSKYCATPSNIACMSDCEWRVPDQDDPRDDDTEIAESGVWPRSGPECDSTPTHYNLRLSILVIAAQCSVLLSSITQMMCSATRTKVTEGNPKDFSKGFPNLERRLGPVLRGGCGLTQHF